MSIAYNRQREAIVGVDRRGNKPKIVIGEIALFCCSEKKDYLFKEERATSLSEVLIDVAKNWCNGLTVAKEVKSQYCSILFDGPLISDCVVRGAKRISKKPYDLMLDVSCPSLVYKGMARSLLRGKQLELFTDTACV